DPPPPIIPVMGHVALLAREMVAKVGGRNASALGRKFAFLLAQDLTQAGLAVASGMARGIDTAAHEGALQGGTVAVLAGGVDVVYPPENQKLYDAIRRRRDHFRNAAGRSATGTPFSPAQPADLRPGARAGGGGSGRAI